MALDFQGNPIPEGMHEYAFDVKLFAAVRVIAPDADAAMRTVREVIDAVSPADTDLGDGVHLTEFSLSEDGEGENEQPYEIDGETP